MEQLILDRICRGQPIRRIGCNGDNVAVDRLCDFIETQIRLLGNRHYPIVVIFDRENRDASASAITQQVNDELGRRGLDDQDIRIFVSDREFEDWYLLDRPSICQHYGLGDDGRPLNGKGGLARLLKPKINYHETTVGVDLFFIVSLERIANSNEVFSDLVNTGIEIECQHLLQIDMGLS